jgi:hypothetical protein
MRTLQGLTSSGFASIRGAALGDGFYNASFSLPGAHMCSIDDDGAYFCHWRVADGDAAQTTLAREIAGCFPGAQAIELPTGSIAIETDGAFFSVRLSSRDPNDLVLSVDRPQ